MKSEQRAADSQARGDECQAGKGKDGPDWVVRPGMEQRDRERQVASSGTAPGEETPSRQRPVQAAGELS